MHLKCSSTQKTRVSRRIESTLYRIQLPKLESVVGQSQPQLVSSHRMESGLCRIQPPELESVIGRSQPQLVSSRHNSSQPWDGASRNSYLTAGTQASCRMETIINPPESVVTCIQLPELETAATRIQPPELELVAGQNQPQQVFSRVSEIYISVGILDFNKYNYAYLFASDNFQLETVNFS